MQNLLRDFLLSYCPAGVRQTSRPESTSRTLQAATWGGFAQLLLAGTFLALRLAAYFVARAHQLGPHLAGVNETGQAVISVVVVFEYLLHPLSLFLLYLAMEGLVRFMGGLITNEVVPSLLVSLTFKTAGSLSRAHARRHSITPLADCLYYLPEGRIRIASDRVKIGWTANITIGFSGEWFEVEREENAPPPRSFVYILRPITPGKILRAYQAYDAASALRSTNDRR